MAKIYRQDLLTLLENLQLRSATLTAELEAGSIPGVFEDCKGFVRIRNGEIVKSAIVGKSGPQVSGPNALKYLGAVSRWLVTVEEDENTTGPLNGTTKSQPLPAPPVPPMPMSPAVPPMPPSMSTPPPVPPPTSSEVSWAGFTPWPEPLSPSRPPANVPIQRMLLPDMLLRQLDRRERMNVRLVFTMVNGQRSIDEIKQLLHLPAAMIDHILEELRRLGVIDW